MPIAGNDDAIRSVSLITAAISDTIAEARATRPAREEAEEGEFAAYSSDAGPVEGTEGGEGDKKKRRPRRKRRPKPEAIVARIKTDEAGPAPAAAPATEESAS